MSSPNQAATPSAAANASLNAGIASGAKQRIKNFMTLPYLTTLAFFIKLAIKRPSVKNSDRSAPSDSIRPINPPIDDKKSTNVYSVTTI